MNESLFWLIIIILFLYFGHCYLKCCFFLVLFIRQLSTSLWSWAWHYNISFRFRKSRKYYNGPFIARALPDLPHRKLLLATDETFLEPSLSPSQRMLQMTTKVPVCADVWILSFFCAVATENWYFCSFCLQNFS